MQSCLTLEVVLRLNIQLSVCIGRGVTGHHFVDNSLPCPAAETEAAKIQKVQLIMGTAATFSLEQAGVSASPFCECRHTKVSTIYMAQSNMVIVNN